MITKNIEIEAKPGETYVITIKGGAASGTSYRPMRTKYPRVDEKGRFTLLRYGVQGPIKILNGDELRAIMELTPGNSVAFTPEASAGLGGATGVIHRLYQNFANIRSDVKKVLCAKRRHICLSLGL